MSWPRAVARKDAIVDRFRAELPDLLRKRGIERITEPLRFEDTRTLVGATRRIRASRTIVATGSRPTRPPIPGIEHAIDSDRILGLERIPGRLVVIGGGVVAMEFASIFGSVGSKVVVLEAGPRILQGIDDELRSGIEALAPSWNLTIRSGSKVRSISREGDTTVVQAETDGGVERFPADVVLVATGRAPNTDGLGLERIGVRVEKTGVRVNEFLETDAEGVYAVGDVHGRFQLTPVATYEAKLAVRNALDGNGAKVDDRVVPQTIFTIPSASSVGLTESHARERGLDVVSARISFEKHGAAVVAGAAKGFVKVLIDRATTELVGVHALGESSEELIQVASLALRARMNEEELLETVSVHPSFTEAFFQAVAKARAVRVRSAARQAA